MKPANLFLERREQLREALGGPRPLAFLTAMLERERAQAQFKPGMTFEDTAYRAGRVAVLDDLVVQLKQIEKD